MLNRLALALVAGAGGARVGGARDITGCGAALRGLRNANA